MTGRKPESLPCCWPKLPEAADVLPYLREIDASRWYTNFGPLSERFRKELAGHFGVESGNVATVANGTLGLVLALMARVTQPGGLCVMPSWTFVATAHAAQLAGLVPYFVDVDPETWSLDPTVIRSVIRKAGIHPSAVVPVCPFGAPLDPGGWESFEKSTAIPVVVDAAAAFDGLQPSAVPAVVSLHATKILGVGEGGLVLSMDAELIRDIERRSNFGFHGSRDAEVPALNAKMSEYHAAVGLAALAGWPQRRSLLLQAAKQYREGLGKRLGQSFLPGFGSDWISATCPVDFGELAGRLTEQLNLQGIESRRWWGDGCHREKAFADTPRGELPVTERLARSVLSLPFYPGIEAADIDRVIRAVDKIVRREA